ncbi:MAG: AI-2E family transporter [Nanoarchaeota archaeon]|nr:AI-2E family transporter [Nanoarchaeota archaeon]
MELSDKNMRRMLALFLILLLAVLAFLLVRPIILSIIAGLLLAYTFFPVYIRILSKIKARNAAAIMVSLFVIILIIIPIYFVAPFLVNQVFGLFKAAQDFNMQSFIKVIFPSAPDAFIVQMSVTLDGVVSKISSAVLTTIVDLLLEAPTIMFHFVIVAFVFFFALRDSDKLTEFVSALSPLNKIQEKKIVQQFKDITNSIVYGQVIIGLVQGVAAGIGFYIFGIPNALILSVLALIFSIIPILGPFFVWIPATVYLFAQGNTAVATVFLLYNLLIVSNIDNVLRLYLLSKKTDLSQVIILIGMIGGLFIFGILGLILGPLILAYFITFLKAYKDNTLSSLFSSERTEE